MSEKNKGGRPKKVETQQKSKIVCIRLTDPERSAVSHRAEQMRLSFSAYCHSAILRHMVVAPVSKEDMTLLRQIAGIGNNLNQLAHRAHIINMYNLENEIQDVLKQIVFILNKLSNDWKNSKKKQF